MTGTTDRLAPVDALALELSRRGVGCTTNPLGVSLHAHLFVFHAKVAEQFRWYEGDTFMTHPANDPGGAAERLDARLNLLLAPPRTS